MVNSAPGSRPAARRPVVPERGDGESVHIFGDIYARYCNGNPFPVLYTRTSDGTRNAHSDKDADADTANRSSTPGYRNEYANMDSDYITYRHGKRIEYPYIDFDEDGNAYVVTERDSIRYPYADTVANTDDANT